jgi:hypothetical protein
MDSERLVNPVYIKEGGIKMYKILCQIIKIRVVEILYWIFLIKLISIILNVLLFFLDSRVKIRIRFLQFKFQG